jgi:hypothetical protein
MDEEIKFYSQRLEPRQKTSPAPLTPALKNARDTEDLGNWLFALFDLTLWISTTSPLCRT